MTQFLPISQLDMQERGWEQLDFVLITGDAYVDHPSFGAALIGRLLVAHGYKVGIISQPDWKNRESITILGEPRLAFLVTSGNMDSMVNHYTVSKKKRNFDAYSPGGRIGKRPDYAVVVYSNLIRQTYKKTPIILGGIEASLRRLAHYDYWSDKIRRSILLDSGADLIVYGMGEHAMLEVAEALQSGMPIKDITYVRGTVVKVKDPKNVYHPIHLPAYYTMLEDPLCYADSFRLQYQNTDPYNGQTLVEKYTDTLFIVQNQAAYPLTELEMDDLYDLPYTRNVHPSYKAEGHVSALDEVKYSLTSNRGCFGGCTFCSLTFHQGRILQVRSHDSLIREAHHLTEDEGFKGYITDVGGPTANFRHPSCEKQLTHGVCKYKQCLFPEPCEHLKVDHSDYRTLLMHLRKIPKVKKVFVRSGIRFDYVMADRDRSFLKELCEHHISGQLRVAPEHVADHVLKVMGKPKHKVYEDFVQQFNQINHGLGMNQYCVPYLMSSHPGCTLEDAVQLAEYCRDLGYMPEQVQDFYPTPSTIATCMYYTGVDPMTMKKVYVPRSTKEKDMQRALLQYRDPKNRELVLKALKQVGREDLIGFDQRCLVKPRELKQETSKKRKSHKQVQSKSHNDHKAQEKKKNVSQSKSVRNHKNQKQAHHANGKPQQRHNKSAHVNH